jgi:hypothetical protein
MVRMNRVLRAALVGVLGLAVFLLAGCTKPVEVAGTWAGLLTWGEGEPLEGLTTPVRLTLVQDEAALSGEVGLVVGQNPLPLPIIAGEVRGNSLEIDAEGTLDAYPPPVEVTIHLEGTSDGTQISGTGSETIGGVVHRFDWQVRPG